jgi:sialate O-acetylesterase
MILTKKPHGAGLGLFVWCLSLLARPLRGEGPLRGFAIRGSRGEWVWASARIEGREIKVWSSDVADPVAVRYGWANNPIVSVENKSGLPLRPFRTDRPR